jgi:hypothetical protein
VTWRFESEWRTAALRRPIGTCPASAAFWTVVLMALFTVDSKGLECSLVVGCESEAINFLSFALLSSSRISLNTNLVDFSGQ